MTPGGCRWVAVRHDEHSVHLVAVLARQDGGAVRIGNDYRRVREACLAAERTFGLAVTAPADRTAATHTTRAEVEKAHRAGGPGRLPDRVWLREQVQAAALAVEEAGAFLDRLRAAGVVVRERRDLDGTLSGYAVARPAAGLAEVPPGPEGAGEGSGVFFGGGRLAPDLTLPRLQDQWGVDRKPSRLGDVPPEVGPGTGLSAASVWSRAGRAAAVAADRCVGTSSRAIWRRSTLPATSRLRAPA